MKQYHYIWKDENKKWWIANEVIVWINKYYDVFTEFWTSISSISEYFIENEPDIWEEIKEEDNIDKIINDLHEVRKEEYVDARIIRKFIQKHMWITKEELIPLLESISLEKVKDILKKRWLYIE